MLLPPECDRSLGPPRRLYLGTPLNGFFAAAGERGAGVAALLLIAERLVDGSQCCSQTWVLRGTTVIR